MSNDDVAAAVEPTQPRRVMIGTPCYDGRVSAEFMQSMLGSVGLAAQNNIMIFPVQVGHDALVQRARNDLVNMALAANVDDLVFVDADQTWNPMGLIKLLSHKVDVVGCPVPKKSDTQIDFNVKVLPEGLGNTTDGLFDVASVGTGMLRITRAALKKVWDASPEYKNNGVPCRMVFEVKIVDGELVSEDNVFCNKWRGLGGKVWLDPSMTCGHIGVKHFYNSFAKFIA